MEFLNIDNPNFNLKGYIKYQSITFNEKIKTSTKKKMII